MSITLADHLMNSGIWGKWFYDSNEQMHYTVRGIDLIYGQVILNAEFHKGNQKRQGTFNLSAHLDDPEVQFDPELGRMVPLPRSLNETLDNMAEACRAVDMKLEEEESRY